MGQNQFNTRLLSRCVLRHIVRPLVDIKPSSTSIWSELRDLPGAPSTIISGLTRRACRLGTRNPTFGSLATFLLRNYILRFLQEPSDFAPGEILSLLCENGALRGLTRSMSSFPKRSKRFRIDQTRNCPLSLALFPDRIFELTDASVLSSALRTIEFLRFLENLLEWHRLLINVKEIHSREDAGACESIRNSQVQLVGGLLVHLRYATNSIAPPETREVRACRTHSSVYC